MKKLVKKKRRGGTVIRPNWLKKETLLYRIHPNGGLVFASAVDALRSDAIHRALEKATTWGEFRYRLPEGEWNQIVDTVASAHELPLYDADEHAGEDIVRWDLNDTSFRFEDIPGALDGDYPEWLQQSMDEVLPDDILSRWASKKSSMFNGSYWHIDPPAEEGIVRHLKLLGFDVRRADHLKFF
jgi:hypothetical protein